jgi:hypothetical protein
VLKLDCASFATGDSWVVVLRRLGRIWWRKANLWHRVICPIIWEVQTMIELGIATTAVLEPPEAEAPDGDRVSSTGDTGQPCTKVWRAFVALPDGSERWMDRHRLFCWVAERMGERMLSGNGCPNANPDYSHLFKARDALVIRLEKGMAVIDELRSKGNTAARAEERWLEILEEYRLAECQLALMEERAP